MQQASYPLELQLLDPEYCLLSNFPISLPEHLLAAHQILPCKAYKGYSVKIKMLNSLKRFIEEFGITIPSLPNTGFRLHKPLITNKKYSHSLSTQELSKQNRLFMSWYLCEHQICFIRHFEESTRRVILGDDWNMGKIVTILSTLYHLQYTHILITTHNCYYQHWMHHLSIYCQYRNKNKNRYNEKQNKLWTINHVRPNFGSFENQGFYLLTYEMLTEMLTGNQWFASKVSKLEIMIVDKPSVMMDRILHPLSSLCCSINHIIISEQIHDSYSTKMFIPLLNPKITAEQLNSRYVLRSAPQGDSHRRFTHRIQYENAINQHYFYKSSRKQFRQPRVIKERFVAVEAGTQIFGNLDNRQSRQSNQGVQRQKFMFGRHYAQLGKYKSQAVLDYLTFLISTPKPETTTKKYYLIYNQYSTGIHLFNILSPLSKYASITCQEQHIPNKLSQISVDICKIVDAMEQLESLKTAGGHQLWANNQTNESLVIFCEMYKPAQGQFTLEYIYKMFLFCEKIQYLVLESSARNPHNSQHDTLFRVEQELFRPQLELQSIDMCLFEQEQANIAKTQRQHSMKEYTCKQQQKKQIAITPIDIQKSEKQIAVFGERIQMNELQKIGEQERFQHHNEQTAEDFRQQQSEPKQNGVMDTSRRLPSRAKKAVQHILTVRLIPKLSQLHQK